MSVAPIPCALNCLRLYLPPPPLFFVNTHSKGLIPNILCKDLHSKELNTHTLAALCTHDFRHNASSQPPAGCRTAKSVGLADNATSESLWFRAPSAGEESPWCAGARKQPRRNWQPSLWNPRPDKNPSGPRTDSHAAAVHSLKWLGRSSAGAPAETKREQRGNVFELLFRVCNACYHRRYGLSRGNRGETSPRGRGGTQSARRDSLLLIPPSLLSRFPPRSPTSASRIPV